MSSDRVTLLIQALPLEEDVSFDKLHWEVFGRLDLTRPPSDIQKRLGPYVSKANARLQGERIVPGDLKRTYRRTRLAAI